MKRSILVLAILAALAVPAVSYVLILDPDTDEAPRWPGARATIHYDRKTIEEPYLSALARAAASWSQVSGSEFAFVWGGPSAAADVREMGNGSSDCYFDATLDRFAYGVTTLRFDGTGVILERDVAFNANPKYADRVRWTTNPTSTPGGPVDFETVAVHELGHVVGLDHPTPDQAGVPSVMNSIYLFPDPAFPNRDLHPDDRAGLRALYPKGSAAGPDLAISAVAWAPAGSGYEISFAARNDGEQASGEFLVSAHLTGDVAPNVLDPLIGTTRAPLSLAPGESTSGTLDGEVPDGTPPGEYRLGVILDSTGATADVDRSNNGAVTEGTIRVTRPPIELNVGESVEGDVGPFGTDRANLVFLPGTRLTFRCWMANGTAALALTRDGTDLVITKPGPKAKLKFRVERAGTYGLDLRSGFSRLATYSIRTKAKRIKGRTTEVVEAGKSVTIPVPAYAGSEVRVIVRGKAGFIPGVQVDGVDAPRKANRSGTKVTVGPFSAPTTGEMTLRITGDASGTVVASWRARRAPDEVLRVR